MNLQGFDGFTDTYTKRMVQEFRLVSPGDKRLRWTAGLFWKDSEDKSGNTQVAVYFPGREGFGRFFGPLLMVPANTHIDELEEYAIFGEVSYDITDQWEATVGLRYSDLEQFFRNTQSNTSDNPVAPKFVLSWRPNDNLLAYVNYAIGFRPGNIKRSHEVRGDPVREADRGSRSQRQPHRSAGVRAGPGNVTVLLRR